MKRLFFTLFIGSTISSMAQTDTIWYSNQWEPTTKENAHYFRPPVKKNDTHYIIKDHYMNGQVQMESYCLDEEGKITDGKELYYFESGKINKIIHYKNGKLDGSLKEFYENGQVKYSGFVKNGCKDGKWESYLDSGELRYSYNLKNGQYNGEIKSNLSFMVNFEAEMKNNQVISYSGSLRIAFDKANKFLYNVEINKQGIEEWTVTYKENIIMKMFFKNNERYGTWKFFNKDGDLLYREITYSKSSKRRCDFEEVVTECDPRNPGFELDKRFLSLDEYFTWEYDKEISCPGDVYKEYNSKGKVIHKVVINKKHKAKTKIEMNGDHRIIDWLF